MTKEFFWPGSVQLKIPGNVSGVSGGIIYPMGVAYHSLMRRDLNKKYPHLNRRLLDPQLYLVKLDPYTCRKKCAQLATYPWFPQKPFTSFNSGEHNQREWQRELKNKIHELWIGQLPKKADEIEKTVKSCIEVQENLDCENYILPSPLTIDQATDYSTELQWLDIGLKVSKQTNNEKPALATIAISDSALRLIEPWENELIDLIIDQVSSREPDGAYIVLEQSNEQGYYCTHHNTVGCLLRLVHGLKTAGLKRIVVAYTGTTGFLSLLAGADTWASGWYKSERRLKLTDIEDTEGRAFPAYYSHSFASEFNVEHDLDHAYKKGLLSTIQEITPASALLLSALKSGKKASMVAEWEYRPANVTAAKEHFVSAAINHTAEIANMSKDELFTYGLKWLENAKYLAEIISKLDNRHPRTEINHQSSWYKAFKNFVEKAK
ncbi:MAG: hypothetical protein ABSH16_08125 [Sedimentisphaerales bacterium]